MSQYYNSNQPVNKAHEQKDGLANGAIIGGLTGATAFGGAGMYRGYNTDRMSKYGQERISLKTDALDLISGGYNDPDIDEKLGKNVEQQLTAKDSFEKHSKNIQGMDKWTGGSLGGGSIGRMIGGAAASIGTGAILGMSIDALNKEKR